MEIILLSTVFDFHILYFGALEKTVCAVLEEYPVNDLRYT